MALRVQSVHAHRRVASIASHCRLFVRSASASAVAAPTMSSADADTTAAAAATMPQTDAEWRKKLTPDEYAVLRQKATEPGDSRGYTKSKEAGVFVCKGCDAPLYDSDTKFDSGCGWPAFWYAQHTRVSCGRIHVSVDSH